MVDEKNLVTERETARYVLKAIDLNRTADDGRVSQSALHEALWSAGMDPDKLDEIFAAVIKAEYLTEQEPIGFLRPAAKAVDQEFYLSLISNDGRREKAANA